jgi:putative FmdB family regulatory protein
VPIYEYVCRDCHQQFELIVRGSNAPACTACGSPNLQKQLSVFAAHTKQAAAPRAAGPCGTCGDPRGPGSCSIN